MSLPVTETPARGCPRGLPAARQQGALHLGFAGPCALQAVGLAGRRAAQTCFPPPGTLSHRSPEDWVTTLFVNPHLLHEFPLNHFMVAVEIPTRAAGEIGGHVAPCTRRASNTTRHTAESASFPPRRAIRARGRPQQHTHCTEKAPLKDSWDSLSRM